MIHRRQHKKGIQESYQQGCLMKVHRTFTRHPLFCEKCRFQENTQNILIMASIHPWASFGISAQASAAILVQFTKLAPLEKS